MSTESSASLECDSIIWKEDNWERGQIAQNIQDITAKTHAQRFDIEIYFLPSVEDIIKDQNITKEISTSFFSPRFFWEHTGWNANGFFGSYENPLGQAYEESCSSYSRFLVKELLFVPKNPKLKDPRVPNDQDNPMDLIGTKPPEEPKKTNGSAGYGYDWQYLAFLTLWFTSKDKKDGPKQVVLCFDQSPTMKRMLIDSITRTNATICRACPYGIYEALLPAIVTYYDRALWDFQKPVRDIEKQRISSTSLEHYDRNKMYNQYIQMHELARHIIHMTETLGVCVRTLKMMSDSHHGRCHPKQPNAAEHYHQTQRELEFSKFFLENLQSRAEAFDQRLHNEITLAFNVFAADDNATAKEILKESQHDGRELTNLVALLTLIFLPLSFFTGFFGMHLFDDNSPGIRNPPDLWKFFAISLPFSFIGVLLWVLFRWQKASSRQREKENQRMKQEQGSTDRVGNKQARRPIWGKQARQMKPSLQTSLPA